MKGLYVLMDFMLVIIFGVTMADLMIIVTGGEHNLLTIDNAIKTLFSLAGLFYLIFIKIIGGIKDAKLNRKIKQEELEKLEMENDVYKDDHNET